MGVCLSMDHSLYEELVNRTVDYYEDLLTEGTHAFDVAYMLETQLTELVPTCGRYLDLLEWAKKNIPIKYLEMNGITGMNEMSKTNPPTQTHLDQDE